MTVCQLLLLSILYDIIAIKAIYCTISNVVGGIDFCQKH